MGKWFTAIVLGWCVAWFAGAICLLSCVQPKAVEAPATQPYVVLEAPVDADLNLTTTQPVVDVALDAKVSNQLGGSHNEVTGSGSLTINEGIPWKIVLGLLAALHLPNPKYRKWFSGWFGSTGRKPASGRGSQLPLYARGSTGPQARVRVSQ